MGILIENCKVSGHTPGSIYIDGGVVARVSESPTQDIKENTVRLDARGGAVYPGFIDTHCHPFELGTLKVGVDLRGTSNVTAIRLRLFAAVQKARPGEWVTGRGWDHEAMSERRLPNKEDIDDITKDNPVILTRVCGHISLLNSKAIQALGIGDRQGPGYDRSASGGLTGIVREGAQEEAFAGMPARTAQQRLEDLLTVEFEAAKGGLTTVHCILSEDGFKEELQALAMVAAGDTTLLKYRVYVPAKALQHLSASGLRQKLQGERIRVNGVKIYGDGSLGASTAALREPYSDDPKNSGLLKYSDGELEGLVGSADREGYQVIVHAIGDRAVEQAISVLSSYTGGGNPRRHRVEHASLLPKDLRSKMRKHDIRATIQPCFIISDSWAIRRLGEERINDLYPLRSMLDDGIIASGSSDAPVETINPIVGMWSAMVRSGYAIEEKITLEQALELYTKSAASNGFDDNRSELVEGAVADLTLLDSDVEDMHPAMFRKVGTAATIVDGRLAYSFEGV
jgi:predicted amidohydrolase YtcJ